MTIRHDDHRFLLANNKPSDAISAIRLMHMTIDAILAQLTPEELKRRPA